MSPWLKPLAWAFQRLRAAIRSFAGVPAENEVHARVYWDEGVALTLTDLVQEAETRASGRVQVITLGEFRGAIGELWERYESRILLIVESTISRMIGRGNTFIPQEKDTWLLLFPALEESEAIERADAIAAKIGEKLVGARFTETPPPLPEAAKLDLSGALNADGSLNLERVKTAVASVRHAVANAGRSPVPAAKKAGAPARPPVSPPPRAKSDAAQLSVIYRPAWTAETQSVNSFYFRATRSDGTDVFAASGAFPNEATVLDLLAAGSRAFSDMCARGLRATLTVPIPFPLLQGAALAEIQRAISALPQRDRLMHLRLEVTHVPARAGADSLVPIRELFRPFVRDIAFLVDLFQPSEQVFALDHIMVGAEIPRGLRRSDDEIFQAMLLFRQRAGQRPVYLLGLASRLQVAHGVTANITELGGPAVVGELKKLPDQVSVIRRQDLIAT